MRALKERQKQIERELDTKMLHDAELQALEEEKRRKQEWDHREQKIAQSMKRMGDNVIKVQEEADKAKENKLEQY